MKKTVSNKWQDTDVEQIVGQLLRYGVLTATIVAFIGGAFYIVSNGSAPMPSYHKFTGEGAGFTTYGGIIEGALSFNAAGIIQLGVLLLIATPVLRIVFSLVGFALEKDRLYVCITLLVLAVIMTSIFGGLKV
ncbi:DUF1634 domain-containing protein [Mucilaginibacter conchicola]|uniref:DUF1634 domain-containing protein n=1 Tax=Mucilaginibacter conchicola TaxID=2303333 RepID=A0A372NXS1_9SPHI|nr:DUF1634 domain-containing protein [Mucilaginibacter conchicola]RFZ94913.1 DUF1634 domain-containing protein [Mucilaginibacter conchicola]